MLPLGDVKLLSCLHLLPDAVPGLVCLVLAEDEAPVVRADFFEVEQGIDVLFTQPNGLRYRWRTTYDSASLKPGDEIPLSKPESMWQGY